MVNTVPSNLPTPTGKGAATSHKCVADIRNTGKASRVVVKFLHKVLHVYVDTGDGSGFKFCLAVQIEEDLKDYHLAFSAATGQVADQMDVLDVTTRYLKDADVEFDDALLAALGDSSRSSVLMYWFCVCSVGFGLLALTAYEWYACRNMLTDQIDAVRICDVLNTYLVPHYVVYMVLTVTFLFSLNWIPVILNAPLAAWRGYLIYSKKYKFSPASLSAVSSKGHGVVGLFVVPEREEMHFSIL